MVVCCAAKKVGTSQSEYINRKHNNTIFMHAIWHHYPFPKECTFFILELTTYATEKIS